MKKNPMAVALGKLGRGKKKTMSKSAIEQRKRALITANKNKLAKQKNKS